MKTFALTIVVVICPCNLCFKVLTHLWLELKYSGGSISRNMFGDDWGTVQVSNSLAGLFPILPIFVLSQF